MEDIKILGQKAKTASKVLARTGDDLKSKALITIGQLLSEKSEDIIKANRTDLDNAIANNMTPALQDRLKLDKSRIDAMAEGLFQIAELSDPIGDIISMEKRPNGLQIGQKRVPLGVVGVIYESRPNVTVDVFGLCLKTGNACILRGGSDAINSNIALVKIIRQGLSTAGITEDAVQFVDNPDRAVANEMMKMNEYIDVLIPRGGAGLIASVIQNSTVPVIETGTGNCHIYVDESADIQMAVDIIYNAKTQRLGTCNTAESLIIHRGIAESALPAICEKLYEKNIEIRGDETSMAIVDSIIPATDEDWGKEYLDAIISVRILDSIDAAIDHINKYNTGHSEAIITRDYDNAMRFLDEVDAAAVYVNASTRFTDGFEFGFGAEVGISTQKTHARGPMGLLALTSYKYIIFGNGQVRP